MRHNKLTPGSLWVRAPGAGLYAAYPLVRTVGSAFSRRAWIPAWRRGSAAGGITGPSSTTFIFWGAAEHPGAYRQLCSIELVLGLAFALLMHRAFPGRGLARTSLLIPWALPRR